MLPTTDRNRWRFKKVYESMSLKETLKVSIVVISSEMFTLKKDV